jgi:cell division septation protein DedD
MRALFLLLLLANVLFFGWSRWVAPSQARAIASAESDQPLRSIRLTTEPAGSPTDAAAAASLETQAAQLADCVSAGPFLEPARAAAAAARLRDQGFALSLRGSRDEVWVGQWVRLDRLPGADAATAALAGLRAAGLTDAYLLTEEPPGTVISLGVFSDAERARAVAGLARDAGYEATVGDRYRTADVVWLDIDRRSNAGLPALEGLQASAGAPARLELRPCPGETAVATTNSGGARDSTTAGE